MAKSLQSLRRLRTPALITVLTLIGSWQLGSGTWIWAKAQLAQYLLERSWAAMQQAPGVAAPKPWPWADTHPAARLKVPQLAVDQIVLAGDSGRTLAFGPGLSSDSAPLDQPGARVISGHRDTHFAFLRRLATGMAVTLQTRSGEHRYRVRETRIVDSRSGGVSLPEQQDGLLLVTCYPFDALNAGGPLRYLVWAEPERPEHRGVWL